MTASPRRLDLTPILVGNVGNVLAVAIAVVSAMVPVAGSAADEWATAASCSGPVSCTPRPWSLRFA